MIRLIRRGASSLLPTASHLAKGAWAPIVAWARTPRVLHNWGDALNPVLVQNLAGIEPVWAGEIVNIAKRPIYYVIGSGLGNLRRPSCEVWGSGFIRYTAKVLRAPQAIHAVRGPLSRGKYLSAGIACPETYGDPALLWPRFYSPPKPRARTRVGLIPHIKDVNEPWLHELRSEPSVKVIDICGGIEKVVNDVTSCDVILSSTLHGLIVADAYGVPSTWVRFQDELPDRWFKYRDYMLSVGRPERSPFHLEGFQSVARAAELAFHGELDIDLERLWDACPFRMLGEE